MPSGLHKITGLPFNTELYESEYKIQDEDTLKLLATGVNPAKKKNKKGKAASGDGAATTEAGVKVDAPNGESKA